MGYCGGTQHRGLLRGVGELYGERQTRRPRPPLRGRFRRSVSVLSETSDFSRSGIPNAPFHLGRSPLGPTFRITLRSGIDHRPSLANPAGLCPIKARPAYGVGVTDSTPEPTLADVLAAINGLSRRVHALEETSAVQGMLRAGFVELAKQNSQHADRVSNEIGQLRQDLLGLKTDQAMTEQHSADLQEAMRRHMVDPGAHRDAA